MVPVCQLSLEITSGSHIHRHAYPCYMFQQCDLVDLVSFPDELLHALYVNMWCEQLFT